MAATEVQAQLDEFLDRYSPEVAALGRAVLRKMRRRFPGAVQLVYDNYNALVIGFGASEKPSQALFSIALYPRYITLFFLKGAGLEDPEGLLSGSGSTVRGIPLHKASDWDAAGIQKLLEQAVKKEGAPMDQRAQGRLILRSVSAKQRPRRPKQ